MSFNISEITHRVLRDPVLHVVLYQPEIPANTGNIARLCGAAQIRLHLIHPLGFRVDDRHLKRAGLDYWHEVDIRHHPDFEAFLAYADGKGRIMVLTRHAQAPYTEAGVERGDFLLFGQETRGLPSYIMESFPCYSVPMWGRVRSLNLSTTVGIVAYHCLHRLNRF